MLGSGKNIMPTLRAPVPDSACTVQFRFSRSTAEFAPKASLADSSQNFVLPPMAAYSCERAVEWCTD